MITIRRSQDRGFADHDWLRTYHTFSFAHYHDPAFTQFHSLRVLNEDRVKPGKGFSFHAHSNMEILSYVLEGTLEHKDSMGTGSFIIPGEMQRMSAGKGVLHSEYNPSSTEPVHFLQIWLIPNQKDLEPSYEQKSFPIAARQNQFCLLASPTGTENSITIHQDVFVYGSFLDQGKPLEYSLSPSRAAWLQVAKGKIECNGQFLSAGDGAAIENEPHLRFLGKEDSEILLFDLFTQNSL